MFLRRFLFVVGLLAALALGIVTPQAAQALSILTQIALARPQGIAVQPDAGLIFVVDDQSNSIVVIDDTTRSIVRTIAVNDDIDAVAYDPVRNRIFTGYSSPIHVIDATTGVEVGAIDESVYGDEEIAVNPLTRKVYIADWSTLIGVPDRVKIYHADTLQKLGQVDVGLSQSIHRVAVATNLQTGMAYATFTGTGEVFYIDGLTDQIVYQVDLPETATNWLAVNYLTNQLFVKCSNTVVVLDGSSGARIGSLPGQNNVAVNSQTNRVYLFLNNKFQVFDGTSLAPLGQLTLPAYSGGGGIGVIPSSGRVYLAMSYSGQVLVIQDEAGSPISPTATASKTPTGIVPTHTATLGASPTIPSHYLPLIFAQVVPGNAVSPTCPNKS